MRPHARRRWTFLTVHILKAGRPLCGFSNDVPCNWPADHRFVSESTLDINEATCEICIETYRAVGPAKWA